MPPHLFPPPPEVTARLRSEGLSIADSLRAIARSLEGVLPEGLEATPEAASQVEQRVREMRDELRLLTNEAGTWALRLVSEFRSTSDVQDLSHASLRYLYRTHGDERGEALLSRVDVSGACVIAEVWSEHCAADGYTLRALLRHPEAAVRRALVSLGRKMDWYREEIREVWCEVILPRLFEEDRSYLVVLDAFTLARERLNPEELDKVVREGRLLERISGSRSRMESVRKVERALLRHVLSIEPHLLDAFLDRAEALGGPASSFRRVFLKRPELSTAQRQRCERLR